jgi:hypothetical protein
MRRILKEFDIIPDFLLECVSVSGIPRKHAHSLQRLHSLAFGCGTFADAKDQASLPLDGLLKDYPTPCFKDLITAGSVPRPLGRM